MRMLLLANWVATGVCLRVQGGGISKEAGHEKFGLALDPHKEDYYPKLDYWAAYYQWREGDKITLITVGYKTQEDELQYGALPEGANIVVKMSNGTEFTMIHKGEDKHEMVVDFDGGEGEQTFTLTCESYEDEPSEHGPPRVQFPPKLIWSGLPDDYKMIWKEWVAPPRDRTN